MDKVLNFQTSLFGSFIDIRPKSDLVFSLLSNLKDDQFIPGTVDLATIDVKTGKLTTESRMQFISQNKTWSIVFLQERIDFNYNFQENTEEIRSIEDLSNYANSLIEKVFSVFCETTGNRLAVNCKILMEEFSEEEFNIFVNRFTIPLSINRDKTLAEWSVRYNHYNQINVEEDKTEQSNCIIEMSQVMNVVNSDKKRVLISLDVNTLQENQESRFKYGDLLKFSEGARSFMKKALQEVEGV